MTLSRFRHPSLAAFAGVAFFTACYRNVPVSPAVQPGARVVAELSDVGMVEMARYVGPGVTRIEGTLVEAADSAVTIAVSTTYRRDGTENLWAGDRVPVPRPLVSGLAVRQVDKKRTALAIGTAVAIVAGIGIGFAVTGGGSKRGSTGGGPR